MSRIQIDNRSIASMDRLGRSWLHAAPLMTPLVKRGMAAGVSKGVSEYRREISGRFKTRRSKVGNSFKWYVTGDKLEQVKAGVFTRWVAAPVYERGLTVRAKGGGALAVPIHPRAYTRDGRVKRKWRDPKNWPDLFLIKTKRGKYLLVQGKKQVKTAFAQKKYGAELGSFRSYEPMYILMLASKRKAMLRFMQTMTLKLLRDTNKALDATQAGLTQAAGDALTGRRTTPTGARA